MGLNEARRVSVDAVKPEISTKDIWEDGWLDGWMDFVKDGNVCWPQKWCQGKRAGKFPAPHHLKVFFCVVDSGCLGYSCTSELVRVAWRANWRVLLNPACNKIIIQLPEPPPEKSLEQIEFSFFLSKCHLKEMIPAIFPPFSHLYYIYNIYD